MRQIIGGLADIIRCPANTNRNRFRVSDCGFQLFDGLVEALTKIADVGNIRHRNPVYQVAMAQRIKPFGDIPQAPAARRHITGDFHHPVHNAIGVYAGRIGRLDPNRRAIFGNAGELIGNIFTIGQSFPEIGVFWAFGIVRGDKNRMVLSDDLVQIIAYGGKKILVGGQNVALRVKLNSRLSAVNQSRNNFVRLFLCVLILRLFLKKQCRTPRLTYSVLAAKYLSKPFYFLNLTRQTKPRQGQMAKSRRKPQQFRQIGPNKDTRCRLGITSKRPNTPHKYAAEEIRPVQGSQAADQLFKTTDNRAQGRNAIAFLRRR